MGTSIRKIAAIAALTSTVWPTIASPQQGGAGGAQIDFGVNSSLRYDDNFNLSPDNPSSATFSDTRLRFSISSVTAVQSFGLTANGTLRIGDIPGRSVAGFEEPTVRLTYVYNVPNSRFAVDARYRQVDREFLDPFQIEREELNFGTLVGDGGTVTNRSLNLAFTTGINDPISYGLTYRFADKTYTDVVNPNLFDTRDDSVLATVGLRLSQVTLLSLNAGRAWSDSDNLTQTQRVTDDYFIGLQQEVNPSLSFTAQLGYTDVETDRLGVITDESGVIGSFNIRQEVADGDYSAQASISRNQNGSRTNVGVGRTIQFPNATLAANIGLTRSEAGSTDLTGNVNWSRTLKDSVIGVSLIRSVSTNGNDEDVSNTRLALSYAYDIDSISRLNLTFDYGIQDDAGAGSAPRVERANLRAAYSRQLTQDWTAQAGIAFRHIDDESDTGSAQSRSIFLTVDRTFSFRP